MALAPLLSHRMVQIQTSSSAVGFLILAFGSLHLLLAEPYATLRYTALHCIAHLNFIGETQPRRRGRPCHNGAYIYDGGLWIVHVMYTYHVVCIANHPRNNPTWL
ncbi:uncharacterized protein LY79DRAFT_147757 [Colletotrichum navitas]|uniref:Uncharacterized protein n=1 Tax=Colletotrichum navitas TaxID=681940 RepID=A0AAD8QBU9_9PEZI|nr:uncharacterized protein LY79DRAFT_147757 [Colletotrichum navitas]KAK1599701.1 hypothetical protein LY79DRAFT_147757 [Colletotrichum navitas]